MFKYSDPVSNAIRGYRPIVTLVVLLVLAAVLVAKRGPGLAEAGKWHYPGARKAAVSDIYHGNTVEDPYRWLEDPESRETVRWVDAQNKVTLEFIASEPFRDVIRDRITEMFNYAKYSLPYKHGDRYFYSKNDGLQNQSVRYMQSSLDGDPQVVIDPNKLSDDGTVSVSTEQYSHDGTLLAYGLSHSGSDWEEIHVRNVDTGEDYDDVIRWCKFAGIAWTQDKRGFFYNRLPEPGTVPDEDQSNFSRVYWHTLGTSQARDKLVHEDTDNKELSFYPLATDDGKYLLLYVFHGTDPSNGLYVREIESDDDFRVLAAVGEAKFSPIDNRDSVLFVETDLDAPRGRVIAIDMNDPDRAMWREIVPHAEDVLDFATMVNDQLVMTYMRDAHHRVHIYNTEGEHMREIKLPTIGTITELSGDRGDAEMFLGFTSFLYATTAFRYDFNSDEVSVFRRPGLISTRRTSRPNRYSTSRRTERESRCSSRTRRVSSSTAVIRRFYTGTGVSMSA